MRKTYKVFWMISFMEKYELTKRGEKLNELGGKYADLVRQGHGLNWDSRTREQVGIANDIVVKSKGFVDYIAFKMITDEWEAPGNIRLSLKGLNLDERDLISEGTASVLEKLHKYNPKYAMTSFISLYASVNMHRSVIKNSPIAIPSGIFTEARAAAGRSHYAGRECIKDISARVSKKGLDTHELEAIYVSSIGEEFFSIDEPVHVGDDGGKWQDFFLKDEGYNIGGEMDVVALEDKIDVVLAELTPREEKVIKMRFGIGEEECTLEEAGKRLGYFSRERMRQIERHALRRLRHPRRSYK